MKGIFNILLLSIYLLIFLFISFYSGYTFSKQNIQKIDTFNVDLSFLRKVFVVEKSQKEIKNNESKIVLNSDNNKKEEYKKMKKNNSDKDTNKKDRDSIKYMQLKTKNEKKYVPIVDVSIKDDEKNIGLAKKLEEFLNLDFIVKNDNVILSHSSGMLNNWGKYFIKNFKNVGDKVLFKDIYGNKIKYKVKHIYKKTRKDYINNFKFYDKYLYVVTCFPIGSDAKREILVLEKIN